MNFTSGNTDTNATALEVLKDQLTKLTQLVHTQEEQIVELQKIVSWHEKELTKHATGGENITSNH